jgi:D-amino peptidase
MLLVGYHATEGTPGGVLDHTMSGKSVGSIVVNGREFGETAMSAMVGGDLGVPTVFLSGDRAACEQAQKIIPGIATVAVKEGLGRYSARCVHPGRARRLISEGVKRALKGTKPRPFVVKPPIELVIEFKDSGKADAAGRIPGTRRVDGHRVAFDARGGIEAYKAAAAMITMALGAP